jgi:hypothetical protein
MQHRHARALLSSSKKRGYLLAIRAGPRGR